MQKPTALVLGATPAVELPLRHALDESVRLVFSSASSEDALEEFRQLAPTVVLALVSPERHQPFAAVSSISTAGGTVIVIGEQKDPDLILRAMRSGAKEFVLAHEPEEMRMAVRAHAQTVERDSRGQIITCFPAKGGVGTTTIATNLAGALHARGLRVCLVDLDLHLGDVLSFMDVPSTYTITDVLANVTRLDRDLLDTSVTKHSSGVAVLTQIGKVEEADQIKAAQITELLNVLRTHYDRVVVDGVRGFDEISLAALDASQHLLMIITQDVPAVRNAQRCLDLFGRLGYDHHKVKLILNRYQRASKITVDVIADTLRLPVARTICNDFVSVIDAINRGVLLLEAAPRARLTQDIIDLAPLVVGETAKPAAVAKGFLRGFLTRRTADGIT